MITLALLAGIWTSTCIQTQIANVNEGYAQEIYSFSKDGSFNYSREWYRDAKCTDPKGTDQESGTIVIGKKLSSIFLPVGDSFEADFSTQSGIDQGAISIKGNKLRLARGIANSSMRNTMLSLFEFTKKD